ncbi:MAG: hypothetical protein Q8N18_18695 [Opitutaceae bacterium]|nr:hypothetical protein [Opitutaceae bacterium]
MTWTSSLFISFLCGALGLVGGGFIMNLCVDWYRVSSFEGKSGFAVVGVALLGGIAGALIGLGAARWVAAGADPGFLKGLGYGSGAVLTVALVALGLCRLGADLSPEMNGRPLELAIEVRCPRGFTIPQPDDYGAKAGVYLPGGRRLEREELHPSKARTEDGHLIVPATVPLTTSSGRKFLQVRFNAEHDLLFHLPLRSQPQAADLEWSKWIESGWDAGKPEPAQEAKFSARYRVQIVAPDSPAPDPAVVLAERFTQISPEAPLPVWLPFMFDNAPEDRVAAVVAVVERRQDELADLIRTGDTTQREQALGACEHLQQPGPAVKEALLAEARLIAEGIRESNAMTADDPQFPAALMILRSRFTRWKQAWWVVQQRLGLDGRPPVKEIHDLASVRARGTGMDEIELNARVILDALNKSAAKKTP